MMPERELGTTMAEEMDTTQEMEVSTPSSYEFHYVSASVTWQAAEDNCVSLGGHLASIYSVSVVRLKVIVVMIWSITAPSL